MLTVFSYLAPALTIVAALMTAANLGSRVTGWGFVVFTLGSLAWLGIGLIDGPPSLVWQNIVLLALNLFGIWRWLGRQQRLEAGADHASRRSKAAPVETLFPIRLTAGAPLLDRDGATLGKAVDGMAARSDGRLTYLVVSTGGVGGVGETLRRVPFETLRPHDDHFRFEGDAARFEALDPIDEAAWPAR